MEPELILRSQYIHIAEKQVQSALLWKRFVFRHLDMQPHSLALMP